MIFDTPLSRLGIRADSRRRIAAHRARVGAADAGGQFGQPVFDIDVDGTRQFGHRLLQPVRVVADTAAAEAVEFGPRGRVQRPDPRADLGHQVQPGQMQLTAQIGHGRRPATVTAGEQGRAFLAQPHRGGAGTQRGDLFDDAGPGIGEHPGAHGRQPVRTVVGGAEGGRGELRVQGGEPGTIEQGGIA